MSEQERKVVINIHPADVTSSGKTHVNEFVRTQAYDNPDIEDIGDGFHRGHMQTSGFEISGRGRKISW